MSWPTTSTHEMTAYLLDRLGRTAVAYIARSRSRALPARWAAPPGDSVHAKPSIDETRRLETAYAIFRSIEDSEADQVARSWLLSANPRLDGATPVELVRNDDHPAVFRAASAFISDS
jgi:hypothetical protein